MTDLPTIMDRAGDKKLGRRGRSPAKASDFALHDFVDVEKVHEVAAAQPWPFTPGNIVLSHYRRSWPMFQNDRHGDCVAAGAFHIRQAWDALDGSPDAGFTDEQVLALYALSGFDPATGANDNGWYLADCLSVMRHRGVLLSGNPDVLAYARVDVQDDRAVEAGHFLFGGLYGGAELPADAQRQYETGQSWTPTQGPGGQPGSWGGHCMVRLDRWVRPDRAGWITWGSLQVADRAWEKEYVDELWACMPSAWENLLARVPYLVRHNLVDFNKLGALLGGIGQVQN